MKIEFDIGPLGLAYVADRESWPLMQTGMRFQAFYNGCGCGPARTTKVAAMADLWNYVESIRNQRIIELSKELTALQALNVDAIFSKGALA